MTQWDSGSQLKSRRPGVSECNDPIQSEFVQVWRLKLTDEVSKRTTTRSGILTNLEHDLNSSVTNLLPWGQHRLPTGLVAKTGLNEFFAVLDEQIPDGLLTDRSDLDEFSESVSNLKIE